MGQYAPKEPVCPANEFPKIVADADRIRGAVRPYDLDWLDPKWDNARHDRPNYCTWVERPQRRQEGDRMVSTGGIS